MDFSVGRARNGGRYNGSVAGGLAALSSEESAAATEAVSTAEVRRKLRRVTRGKVFLFSDAIIKRTGNTHHHSASKNSRVPWGHTIRRRNASCKPILRPGPRTNCADPTPTLPAQAKPHRRCRQPDTKPVVRRKTRGRLKPSNRIRRGTPPSGPTTRADRTTGSGRR